MPRPPVVVRTVARFASAIIASMATIVLGHSHALRAAPTLAPQDTSSSAGVVACFADDADPEYVEVVNAAIEALNEGSYQLTSRWPGAQGTPITLTWSFVPDGLVIPNIVIEGSQPSTLFADMDTKFGGIANRAVWISRFQQAFDRWSQVSGVTFMRVTSPGNDWDDGAAWGSAGSATRGDIRICMKSVDGVGGIFGATLLPSNGDMMLDSAEIWGNSTNSHRFLRNFLAHESGHGLGLLHVCPIDGTKLMESFFSTAFDGPRHDDLRGIQRHYGDPQEDDNSAGLAAFAGTLAGTGSTLASTCAVPAGVSGSPPPDGSICSIDANGEVDYFRVSVSQPGLMSVTVTPAGFVYLEGGSCGSESSLDSDAIANLSVQLIASDGVTVLATADAAPLGSAETISSIYAPAGDVYVRIYENDSPVGSQLYTLSIELTQACAGGTPDCNVNGQADACDVASGNSDDANANAIPDECELGGTPYCFGDGIDPVVTAQCPCGNVGGAGHGCANSFSSLGGFMTMLGSTSNPGGVLCVVTSIPNNTLSVGFRNTANQSPAGVLFGDGIRCQTGTLVRFSAHNSGTQGELPNTWTGFAAVVPAGLTRYYQVQYRNASPVFCPPATFNITNGYRLTW